MNNLNIGILIVAFNRDEHLKKVLSFFDFKLKYPIYIYIDGPRNDYDIMKQRSILKILQNKRISNKRIKRNAINLGCKYSIPLAIEWFFKNSDCEICVILEDDCVPGNEFIQFIVEKANFLEKPQFGIICGTYPIKINIEKKIECISTRYGLIHGWAISRNTWLNLKSELFNRRKLPKNIPFTEKLFWKLTTLKVETGILDTWDAHFNTYMLAKNLHNIAPTHNLVTNIGYDQFATHSTKETEIKMRRGNYADLYFDNKIHEFNADHIISKYFFNIKKYKAPVWVIKIIFLSLFRKKIKLQYCFQQNMKNLFI